MNEIEQLRAERDTAYERAEHWKQRAGYEENRRQALEVAIRDLYATLRDLMFRSVIPPP